MDCGNSPQILVEAGIPYPFDSPKKTSIPIGHSLSESVSLRLNEAVKKESGDLSVKPISEYTFLLPLYYTGDQIEVSLDIDEAGLYKLKAKHLDTREQVEFESKKEFTLSELEIQKKKLETAALQEA